MNLSKYYYNSETCRYEPKRTSVSSILGYGVLFAVSTTLIFVAVLFLHSKIFLTENGKNLKNENHALEKHFASLQQQESILEGSIDNLKDKNSALHEKLFEVPLEKSANNHSSVDQSNLLLADASVFNNVIESLKTISSKISRTASGHNNRFSKLKISKKEKAFLLSLPSIRPVENTELSMLVSGFGMRINPFHKGSYHHPGADFAAPRGSSVIATGNGKVIKAIKGSVLQAGYGNYIEIEHSNGLITRYAHLDDVTVKVGQRIGKGSVIGTVGMSGGSVAPHVHYEIIRKGDPVDPVPYMMENLTSDAYSELQILGSKKNQSLD